MTITTRRPTGKPSWPIITLAGREGTGKTWAAIQASASKLVGRTLVVTLGEDQPDEYALIPGADFEIVEHDGTVRGLLNTIDLINAEPDTDGKPTLLILDSGSRYWQLLSDNAQNTANGKAKNANRGGDATVTVELWNEAAKNWTRLYDKLRAHRGPVILTARLEQVAIMDGNRPTAEKDWKIQAHKSLPYDAQVIVEMPERGEYLIRKVKSARWTLKEKTPKPDFTVDWLWHALGLGDTEVQEREFSQPVTDPEESGDESGRDWLAELAATNNDIDAVAALGAEATKLKANREAVVAIRKEWTRLNAIPQVDPADPPYEPLVSA